MSRILTMFILSSTLMVSTSLAQVSVWNTGGVCQIGTECSFDVWVGSGVPLGRLAIVLKFDNSQIQIIGLDDHHFMPTTQRIWFANDICTETTLCDPPGGCGQIDYLGLDTQNLTTGLNKVITVHYQIQSSTQMNWNPCEAWCNPYICVSLVPVAGSYDGTTTYSMSWSAGQLIATPDLLIDSDGDGLNDDLELLMETDPYDADTDDDGLLDGPSPTLEGVLSTGGEDLDADGFVAPWETAPLDADSDDDGLFDGTESGLAATLSPDTDVAAGVFVPDADPLSTTDPTDPDSDDDGALDGVEDSNGNGAVDPGEADPQNNASTPVLLPPATGVEVLLLGDFGSTAEVQSALENAGHVVTVVDPYHSWDGIDPSVDDFGVVILLDGDDYGYDLEPAASAALATFVNAGGGMIFTEWMSYDVCYDSKTGPVVDLMPVVAPDCDYGYGATWSVTSNHELTQGLPPSWTESEEGFGIVNPAPGAIVLVRSETGNPLLIYSTQQTGTVVYINNTLTYSTASIDPNLLTTIVNSVGYAIPRPFFADGFETGDTSAWSAAH